jgi:thiol-disulfide isomerase/thioredoxin
MKRILLVAIIFEAVFSVCSAQEELSPDVGKILKQAHNIAETGSMDGAVTFLDKALLKYTDKTYDRYSLLNYKYDLLTESKRDEEAVKVCVEKANIVLSPRQALIVAGAYLKLNELDKALEWLETSVKRGLQNYIIFDSDLYAPLRNKERFKLIVETIKKNNGLGLAAKPFKNKSIDDENISLEMYKGKVVLLDFWATWCLPCRTEMPNVLNCYKALKNKGFEIIGFANEDTSKLLKTYLLDNEIEWPIVAQVGGNYKATATLYNVSNIPASFLIDKQGILRHVNLTGSKLFEAISELVNE